jgi:dCTP deaminase
MLDIERQVGSSSIDLRLGTDFLLPRRSVDMGVDPAFDTSKKVSDLQERVVLPLGQSLCLQPQQFVLGSTLEFIKLPVDCAAAVLGRSSWGRVGLLVATAVTVQPGYTGSLTLELINEGDIPMRLWPGLCVAQLVVEQMDQATERPYDKGYVRAIGPETARLGWDRAEVRRLDRLGKGLSMGS